MRSARVSTARGGGIAARRPVDGVRSLVHWLAVLRMRRLVLVGVLALRRGIAARQIDVDPSFVLLRVLLQSQLPAQSLYAGLDLLDVAWRVVALADNDVQVSLAVALGVADPLLEDLLGFFDELPVQIDGVGFDLADGVVLAEDELGGLLVVLVGLGGVGFGLQRHLVGLGAIAALVGLAGFASEVAVLVLLFAGEVTQAVIFLLRIGGLAIVVEGW